MSQPVFRFAPSPNGALHLGHAYSALLNAKMAREAGGRFLVRIEDTDLTRCRPEFTAQALDDLAWLGLSWEEPVRVQSEHFDDYQSNLDKLWAIGAIFPCFCSRSEARAHAKTARDPDGQPRYGGLCRGLRQSVAASRMKAGEPHGWRIDLAACGGSEASEWGCAVIAKRQTGSSYHIAAVTDDHLQGVTHVVRGKDMEPSTSIHKLLQRLLGFPTPDYHHHDLILDGEGRKLSKSIRSRSLQALRSEGAIAEEIRRELGFE